jgi:hypothetical protein
MPYVSDETGALRWENETYPPAGLYTDGQPRSTGELATSYNVIAGLNNSL